MSLRYIDTSSGIPRGESFTLEQMQVKFPQHDFAVGPPTGYSLLEPVELPPKEPMQTYVFGNMHKKPGTEIWTNDVTVREMYPYEKAGYIEDIKRQFYANTGYLSWTYDPLLNRWSAPKMPGDGTPPPDGSKYVWNEAQQEWILQEI